MKSKALVVFRKNATLGKVKTRIAQESNSEVALEIYNLLCQKVEELVDELELDIIMFYSDVLPLSTQYSNNEIQNGKDLGERMANAFSKVLQKYNSVVLIGTDCPYITSDDLSYAFKVLETNDIVIGPAWDGGYYLIGMNKPNDFIFQDIPWSTNLVLMKTLTKIQNENLSYYQLISYSDVDQMEDWYYYINR